jgi:hypothetical protein
MTNSLHLDAFCQFWEMNFNSPVPPLPQQPSDLSVTQLEQLRMYDGGKLFQNLFRVTDPTKLPANLLRDLSKGIIDHQNKDLYKKYNYEYQYQEIEKAEQEYQNQKIEKEIAEMEKRNAETAARNEARSKLSFEERMLLEPLTQEQIINNQMKYHGRIGR